jgi:hypothetical protein
MTDKIDRWIKQLSKISHGRFNCYWWYFISSVSASNHGVWFYIKLLLYLLTKFCILGIYWKISKTRMATKLHLTNMNTFMTNAIHILFLVEKSLARINCLVVCPHFTDWSKNDTTMGNPTWHDDWNLLSRGYTQICSLVRASQSQS